MIKKRMKSKKLGAKFKVGRRKIPIIIGIISILFFISALVNLVFGGLILLQSLFGKVIINFSDMKLSLAQFPNFIPEKILINEITLSFMILFALLIIIIAFFEFFIGKGLWRGKRWAWMVTIVLMIFGMIKSAFFIFSPTISWQLVGVVGVVIYGSLSWYLIFNKEVKKYF